MVRQSCSIQFTRYAGECPVGDVSGKKHSPTSVPGSVWEPNAMASGGRGALLKTVASAGDRSESLDLVARRSRRMAE